MAKAVRRFFGAGVAAILGAALVSLGAQAAVIDFEGVTPTLVTAGESVAEDGFTLVQNGDFGTVDTAAGCFIAACPIGNDSQFYSLLNESSVTLSFGGGTFGLLGFDAGFIAPFDLFTAGLQPGLILLQANFANATSTLFGVEIPASEADGFFPFANIGMPGFMASGLSSVVFSSCTYSASGDCLVINDNLGQFAIDNIQVTTPIPEPATLGLLALGLAGVAARRRAARSVG